MKLLLISNSTNPGEEYLKYPMQNISRFIGSDSATSAIFIPYAAVSFSYDEYIRRVRERFAEIDVKIDSIHEFDNPLEQIKKAKIIVVGGGNTFALVKKMQEQGLIDAIRNRVKQGALYIGWSAGSNVACPTICTTNDMPIVEPESFKTTALIPFQINPHYLDINPKEHAGETREQRIEEYIAANPDMYVVGLREGCMLEVDGERMSLIGDRKMRIFKSGEQPREVTTGDDLSFLL